MIDNQGRSINYLRVSITDRCNLRCVYCMPKEGIKSLNHEEILSYEDILKIVRIGAGLGVNKIRYTGGEPLVRKDIDKLIYETSKLPGIEDIAITTNGILLSQIAGDLKRSGLKRVNISLDTLDKDKFISITRNGDIDKVFESIYKCLFLGLEPVKINTVLMKGINDTEIDDFINLTKELPIEIRFIELMPIGESINLYKERKLTFEEVLKSHPELIPMGNEKNSTAQLYKVQGAKGKIGAISPISCKFCSTCNRIRLTSTGTLKQCLHSKDEINIKKYVDNEEMLINQLKAAIFTKPVEHYLKEENSSRSNKMMFQIGG